MANSDLSGAEMAEEWYRENHPEAYQHLDSFRLTEDRGLVMILDRPIDLEDCADVLGEEGYETEGKEGEVEVYETGSFSGQDYRGLKAVLGRNQISLCGYRRPIQPEGPADDTVRDKLEAVSLYLEARD